MSENKSLASQLKVSDWIKLIGISISLLGILGTAASFYVEYKINEGVRNYVASDQFHRDITHELEKIDDSKETSLSYKLAQKFNIDRGEIPLRIFTAIKEWDAFKPKLKTFEDDYIPMLDREKGRTMVGLRVNNATKELYYKHWDLKDYHNVEWSDEYKHYMIKTTAGYYIWVH